MNPAKRKKMYRARIAVQKAEVSEVVEEVVQEPVVEAVVEEAPVETVSEPVVEEVKTTTRRSKKVVEPVAE